MTCVISPFIQEILLNHPDRRKFPENLEYFKQKLRVHVDINKKIMRFANGKIKKLVRSNKKIMIFLENKHFFEEKLQLEKQETIHQNDEKAM